MMPVEVRCFGPREAIQNSLAVKGYDPWLELSRGSDPRLEKVLGPLSVDLALVRDPLRRVLYTVTLGTRFLPVTSPR